jgi:hypothetical protein
LQETIAGVNVDRFIVRQHRRAVEKYRDANAWQVIDDEARKELVDEIAPLPTAQDLGTEEAKRFDLLIFSLQLAHLKGSKRFDALKKQLQDIVAALELQMAIPAVAQRAVLIEEIQTENWWEGVTVPLLELVRLRLRDLVQHIDKSKKAIVYSNFADEIGEGVEHELPQVGEADFARFKQKARHFLKAHEGHYCRSRRLKEGTMSCQGLGIRMDRLDEIVIDELSSRILQPERLGDLLKTYLKSANSRSNENKEWMSRLRQSHRDTETGIRRLLTLVEQGVMEAEDASLKERLVGLKVRRDELAAEVTDLQKRIVSGEPTIPPEKITQLSSLLKDKLQNGSPELKQAYTRLAISEV